MLLRYLLVHLLLSSLREWLLVAHARILVDWLSISGVWLLHVLLNRLSDGRLLWLLLNYDMHLLTLITLSGIVSAN